MGFAENLREELKFQDIQIKQLSAKTGISKNTIDKYLSEKRVQPGVENAVKLRKLSVSQWNIWCAAAKKQVRISAMNAGQFCAIIKS